MNLFQRVTATFTSKIDRVVSQVENHDAVVEAALRETHAAAAKARVRLARITKDGEAIRRSLREAEAMEQAWTERAVRSAREDEAKALDCIARRNASRRQAAQNRELLARHETAERDIAASVERIEQRLAEITRQRNQLRSRHSAADALQVISRIEGSSAHGLEDIFDRWEMRIVETEYADGAATQIDPLAESFHQEETQAALKAELDQLLEPKA